jgi:hypothetical protein
VKKGEAEKKEKGISRILSGHIKRAFSRVCNIFGNRVDLPNIIGSVRPNLQIFSPDLSSDGKPPLSQPKGICGLRVKHREE